MRASPLQVLLRVKFSFHFAFRVVRKNILDRYTNIFLYLLFVIFNRRNNEQRYFHEYIRTKIIVVVVDNRAIQWEIYRRSRETGNSAISRHPCNRFPRVGKKGKDRYLSLSLSRYLSLPRRRGSRIGTRRARIGDIDIHRYYTVNSPSWRRFLLAPTGWTRRRTSASAHRESMSIDVRGKVGREEELADRESRSGY